MSKKIVLPIVYDDEIDGLHRHMTAQDDTVDEISPYRGMINVDNITLDNSFSSDTVPMFFPKYTRTEVQDDYLNMIAHSQSYYQHPEGLNGIVCDDIQTQFTTFSHFVPYTQFKITSEGYYIYEEIIPVKYYTAQHREIPHGNLHVRVNYNALYYDGIKQPLFIGSPAYTLTGPDDNILTLTHVFPTKPVSALYFQSHPPVTNGIYLDYLMHGVSSLSGALMSSTSSAI